HFIRQQRLRTAAGVALRSILRCRHSSALPKIPAQSDRLKKDRIMSKRALLGMSILLVGLSAELAAAYPLPEEGEGEPAIAPWAIPSDTGHSVGSYIGGGCLFPRKAEPRLPEDGTWGWDYQGWFPRRVILGWWHGRKFQGGTGAYKTD